MVINNCDISFDEAIAFAKQEDALLKRRKNGILLSDYQVEVLKRNGIDYLKYSNMQELLFDIEEILNTDFDEELDTISSQLSELAYYRDTKKWELIYLISLFKYLSF